MYTVCVYVLNGKFGYCCTIKSFACPPIASAFRRFYERGLTTLERKRLMGIVAAIPNCKQTIKMKFAISAKSNVT